MSSRHPHRRPSGRSLGPVFRPALLTAAIVPVLAVASAGFGQTTYTGLTLGDWATGTNWSAGAPNAGTDAIINNNASAVTVVLAASATGNVRDLRIDLSDMLWLNNNSALNINGNLLNNGTLRFVPVANNTFLRFNSATATISGSGVIDLNYAGGGSAVITGPASGTLTNTSTIRGSGTFDNIRFTNAVGGVLENHQTTGQMYLDANNAGGGPYFINQGTVRALAGSLVTFAGDNGGGFDSTGGAIQANGAGAVVRLINGASITGGNYSTSAGGTIAVEAGHTATASPQSNSGLFEVRNNARLFLTGAFNNTGTFRFSPNGNETFIRNDSPLTLNGTGVIEMNWTAGAAGVFENNALMTLGSGQTVRGVGTFRNANVVNNGLIDANDGSVAAVTAGAGIYLDPRNTGGDLFVNNGTMRASNGGFLVLAGDNGGNFDNTNGAIGAIGNGSRVELINGIYVKGGAYNSTGTGLIRVRAGNVGSISDASLAAGSTFAVANNARLDVSGALTNNGTFSVEPVGNSSTFRIAGDTTLSGTGTIRLNSNGSARAVVDGGGTLTIGANQTIRGSGYWVNMRVVNNGTIIGDDSNSDLGGTYIDANNASGTQFVNNGAIQVTAGNFLSLVGDNGGAFSGTGTYRADGALAFLHLANNVDIVGGTYTTTAGGVIRVPAGHIARVDGPTLTAGTNFNVENNSRLYIRNTVTNPGTLTVTSGANNAYLTVDSASVALSGNGLTRLVSNPGTSNAQIDTGGNTLTITAGQTVSGNGYFSNARVINNGLILADLPTGSMYLDPWNGGSGDQFMNNGTIRAVAGATVTLAGENGGNFAGNGVYRAEGANAFVNMVNGILVKGGTFSTGSGGVVRVPAGQTGYIDGSTLAAGSTFNVENNAFLYIRNTITNNGTLAVTSGANNSYLRLDTSATLTGNGVTRLTNNPGVTNATIDTGGDNILTIAAGHTVAGTGWFNNARVVNNGLILADQVTSVTSMYLDPWNGPGGDQFMNNGTIRAVAGATVTLAGEAGGNFAGNGIYRAEGANAFVGLINSILVKDGTFSTGSGGVIRVPAGQTGYIDGSTLAAGSTFNVENNASLYIRNTITNNGTLAVTSGANNSYLRLDTDATLTGSGVTRMTSNPGVSNAIIDTGGDNILTIAAGHTVAGTGWFNNARVVNNGLILADQVTSATSMYLDPNNGGAGRIVNNGTIRAANGGIVTLAGDGGGNFAGSGVYTADAGGLIQTVNSLGGDVDSPVTGAGTFRATSSSNAGFRHYRIANLEATNSGTIRVNPGGGNAGTSKVNSITINTNGRLDLTDHGLVLDYTGPSPANDIRALITSGRNGGPWNGPGIRSSLANNSNGRGIGYGEANVIFTTPTTFMGQTIDATSILIRFTLLGDTNLDGTVNFEDLLNLAQNYNDTETGRVWTSGDFNYDGKTNFDDLLSLAQNYSMSLALTEAEMASLGADFMADFTLAQSMVPEPASLSVLLGLALLGRRRRADGRPMFD